MRIVHRLIGALLLTSLAAAPLGVAAEGYVCASSGMRMNAEAKAACSRCAPATDAAPARSFERPCCVYVGATALPPVLSVASIALAAPARAAVAVPPGMTVTASPPQALGPALEIDSGSSPPANIRLVEVVHLRN